MALAYTNVSAFVTQVQESPNMDCENATFSPGLKVYFGAGGY